MALIVQKFGGTSVGNVDRIKNVAKLIKREIDNNNKVVVVVSAMAGVTDQLVNYTLQFSKMTSQEAKREYDTVLAAGEKISSGLLSLALQNEGIKSRSWQGWQIPIITTPSFADGKILEIKTELLEEDIENGIVPIISGFQGVANNNIVTLGRGGSDTTAAAVAAALQADRCDIYTDVDGVYTSDPRIVVKAKKIHKIKYNEMLELAYGGAKVLHPRAVEFGVRYNLKMQVRSSFVDQDGTVLVNDEDEGLMEENKVTGISYLKDLLVIKILLSEENKTQYLDLLSSIKEAEIPIEGVYKEVMNGQLMLTIVVPKFYRAAMESALKEKSFDYSVIADVAKVNIVGSGMVKDLSYAEKLLHIISELGINILNMATSEIKISVMINMKHLEELIVALHSSYGLDS
jgi:aspartate kinase